MSTDTGSGLDELDSFRSRRYRFSTASGVEGPGVLDIVDPGYDPDEQAANALHNDSSSVIEFFPQWCRCFKCLRQQGPYTPNATFKDQLRTAFLCPPRGPSARILSFVIVFVLGWLFLWLLLERVDDNKSPADPRGGPIFALGIIEFFGLISAIVMKLVRLPSLLGPLLLGILIRNIEAINLFRYLEGWHRCNLTDTDCILKATANSTNWIYPIREIALTMILTRAGLELSPKQLKKLKGVVPLLAFGPCVVEASACALFTWLFFNVNSSNPISVPMCFVSGFALAAVSPAVVVPGMVALKKKNLGVGQAIPTLLIAASSIDDVLAISAYTIFLGLALPPSLDKLSGWEDYAGGPLSIVVGICHGLVFGIFLHFIPSKDNKKKAETRLILLLLLNFVAIFGYDQIELLSGAGSLSSLVTSFIASFGWRSQSHWKKPMKTIERTLGHLWTLVIPLLFGTIGREIDFGAKGFTAERVGKIIAIIFLSLLIRCCTAFLIAGVAKLNYKERLFCAITWIPKATVQAALAPLVLTKIQERIETNPEYRGLIDHGEIVVTTAVLAILITAPLGSILIYIFGPLLLRTPTAPEIQTLDEEFPDGDGVDPETGPGTPLGSRSQQLYRRSTIGSSVVSLPASTVESNIDPRNAVSADAILIGDGDQLKSWESVSVPNAPPPVGP